MLNSSRHASDEPGTSGSRRPTVHISRATFSDGKVLKFDPSDIVVFVGPNNSGKSEAIRNLWSLCREATPGKAVQNVLLSTAGTAQELVEWLSSRGKLAPSGSDMQLIGDWGVLSKRYISGLWESSVELQNLSSVFTVYLNTEARLSGANAPQSYDATMNPPQNPIQRMYADDSLELRIRDSFRQAFSQDIIVNRVGGNFIPLHVGQIPALEPGEDRLSVSYLRKICDLPRIEFQGDGMRSYAGVILHTMASDYSMVFVDEPEAFLHPPQAKALAKALCSSDGRSRQLFVATHSGDFLRGLLDHGGKRVRVARLCRSGIINRVTELAKDQLAELWTDPLLRYSQVLDALFHDRAIICESEADCRFYSAIAATVAINGREDVIYLHCGGKDRLSIAAKALRALDVPVGVVADFDILNGEQPFRRTIEGLGGTWGDYHADWELIRKSVEERKAEIDLPQGKEAINKVLDSVSGKLVPRDARERIQAILRQTSPWDRPKTSGRAGLPSGQATAAFDRLDARLKALGLFVVAVGEMEGFCKSVGGHGPAWLNEVLRRDLAADPELASARSFVSELVSQGGEVNR